MVGLSRVPRTAGFARVLGVLFFVIFIAQAALVNSHHDLPPINRSERVRRDAESPYSLLTNRDDANIKLPGSLDIRQVFEVFPNTWQGRVDKGRYLKCLFPLNNAEAQKSNNDKSIASQFTDKSLLARWGWNAQERPGDDDGVGPGYGTALDEAFNDPEHKVNTDTGGLLSDTHNDEFVKTDGMRGYVSSPLFMKHFL